MQYETIYVYAIEFECIQSGLPWQRFELPECFYRFKHTSASQLLIFYILWVVSCRFCVPKNQLISVLTRMTMIRTIWCALESSKDARQMLLPLLGLRYITRGVHCYLPALCKRINKQFSVVWSDNRVRLGLGVTVVWFIGQPEIRTWSTYSLFENSNTFCTLQLVTNLP